MAKPNEVVAALAASLNPGGQVVTVVVVQDTEMNEPDESGILTYVFAGALAEEDALARVKELLAAEDPDEDPEEAAELINQMYEFTVQYTDLL